jgi:predicted permease
MIRRSDEDFRAEVESHLALERDRLIAEGMTPLEAEDAAHRKFGSTLAATERFYTTRRLLLLDRLRLDVRYAVKYLRQSPVFTSVTVLTLAIGIGASTAVATQINAVFFQGLHVDQPSSLRSLTWSSPRRGFAEGLFRGPTWDARTIDTFPAAMFLDIQRQTKGFADVACWRTATEALTDSRLLRVHAVSGTYFRTLGIDTVAGRPLTPEDDGPAAPLVAVARDRALLNQAIRLHGHVFTVVGVVPEDFWGLNPLEPADVFVPYAADQLFPTFQRNSWAQCHIITRLEAGVDVEQAQAETQVLVQRIIASNPPKDPYEAPLVYLEDLGRRFAEVQRNAGTPLRLFGATVGILLLVTCANIGGLLFARGRARRKEIATRLALGGPRTRIVQQLLTESFVLCALGGVAGIGVAYALSPLLPRVLNEFAGAAALGVTLRPDLRVLAFSVAVSGACGILFGLFPALFATRLDSAAVLKQSSGIAPPARLRAGRASLVVQLALSMVVLGGAGLLVRTMENLRAVPIGYVPEGLVFVESSNPVGRPRAFVEETLAQLEALPGIRGATVSQWPIFNNALPRATFCVPGAQPPVQELDLQFVFPGFFDTWGVPIVLGRDIDDSAESGAIVNRRFVSQFFPGRNPLGQMIGAGGGGCPGRSQIPIVGVVADHIDRQRVELIPAVYLRYPRAGALYVTTYAVRTDGDVRPLITAVRRIIAERGIAPNRDVTTGVEYRDGITRRELLMTRLLAVFAAISLFISCLGIYGVLAYSVSWRSAEIGLRMAVGARRSHVMWMVVRESLAPLLGGLAVGIAGAIVLGRSIETVLFKVSAHDPATLAAAALVMLLAGAAASCLPARRACTIDPVQALRCE